MFTLRVVEKTRTDTDFDFDEAVENFYLGNSYTVLRQGLTKEFDKLMSDRFKLVDRSNINALLVRELDCDIFFIYQNTPLAEYSYYIVTEGGKTFEKL